MSKRLSIGLRVRNVEYESPDVAIVYLYNGIDTVVAAENGKAPLDAPFATDPFDGTGAFRYDEALGAWRYVGVTGG